MDNDGLALFPEKISIIIPIFNVESFLRKCINSVTNQTYKNIEIILVDDGSDDNCPFICDEYAQLDSRIKVIHKEHGGVSDARNVGIDNASGDYVGFVDSDDWIEQDMYRVLHSKALALNTEITICGYNIVKNNKKHLSFIIKEDTVLSGEEALIVLLNDTMIKNYPWNKLYKMDLFKEIRYPVGMNYEDIATTFKLIALSKRIAIIPNYLYNYMLREKSISQQKTFQNIYDLYKAYEYRLCQIEKVLPEYRKSIYELTVSTALVAYNLSLKEQLSEKDEKKVQKLISSLKEYSKQSTINDLKEIDKLRIKIIEKSKTLYKVLYFIYSILSPRIARHPSLKCLFLSFWGYLNYRMEYQREVSEQVIFLIGTPEHNNLGDHAITYATKEYLTKKLPEYRIIEIPENKFFMHLPGIKNNIKKSDCIVYSGGGNIGNEYLYIEIIRRIVVKAFPHNKIIIFPQTIYFSDDLIGKRQFELSKKIYSAHSNLTIVAREQYSFEILSKQFKNNTVLLAPDMAMYLKSTTKECIRDGVAICLRDDNESIFKYEDRSYIKECFNNKNKKVIEIDTCSYRSISENERVSELEAKLSQFKQAEIVVTDRLHGMIFSAITDTPCIVLSNYNYKILGSYKWLKHLKNIIYVDDIKKIREIIDQLSICDYIAPYSNEFIEQYYSKIVQKITEK